MTEFLDLIEQAPEACTLPTADRPLRVAEFAELFATATRMVARSSPTRAVVTLPLDSLDLARDLAARETACCSFFTFNTVPVGGFTEMTIDVPAQHAEVLTALTNLVEAEPS